MAARKKGSTSGTTTSRRKSPRVSNKDNVIASNTDEDKNQEDVTEGAAAQIVLNAADLVEVTDGDVDLQEEAIEEETAPKNKCQVIKRKNTAQEDIMVSKIEEFEVTEYEEGEVKARNGPADDFFSCEICDKVFTRKYHLDRHLQLTPCSGQPPPSHPCDVCGKVYTRKDNLREHLRVHAGEVTRKKRFQCSVCPKMFHGASLLKIHERTHSGEKPFVCDFCPKSFPSGGALTKHRRIHTGEKPYACPSPGCNVRFSLKGTLNRHMRIHTGIRPHKCPHCDKSFIQVGGLKAHMFYHTGEGGFKCEYCDKVFNRKARLQMHTRYVHEKEKPFQCSDCNKRFTRKEDLNRHAVLHTGEKKYKCDKCDKSFAIRPSLKLHMMTHTKEEPRSCHECGRAFIRRDCLIRHIRKKHRGKLDEILKEEEEVSSLVFATPSQETPKVLSEEELLKSIKELLLLLVDEPTLKGFGWPDAPIDQVLESVIKRCGHNPVKAEDYEYFERLRENSKLLFTVVIDDNAVKTLLNNKTVDEVILHVLRMAK